MTRLFHQHIDSLVASIAESHREHDCMSSLQACKLPSKDTIIEIIHSLRELLFPGYFGKQNLVHATISYQIGDLLIGIHERLHEQIRVVLEQPEADASGKLVEKAVDNAELDRQTDEIIHTFFTKIPEIRRMLATDVQAAYDGDPSANDFREIIFSFPGILAVSIYRLAHELYKLQVPLIPRIMTEYAHSVTGIDIHAGASIGEFFFIDHGTGVVIGETTIIGSHVKIYQGVTLGALSTRGGQSLHGVKRHPTIEDDVTVYSGASILGGGTVIGQGVLIGSNAFITQSVPSGTRVSIKNPELVFKGRPPQEFVQEPISNWVI